MKRKILALCLAFSLVLVGAIGGTMAWLTAQSGRIVNTFTGSNITIKLEETTGIQYKMVPGCVIAKDPKVTVETGSEKCYLFVKLEKSANFDTFLTYQIGDGWTALSGVGNVYYRIVETTGMGTAYSVLKDNQVLVKNTVTKEMMTALTTATNPTLTATAFASQFNKNATDMFSPAEAWAAITSSGS